MKRQLDRLTLEMFTCGILFSEAVREFKRSFITTALQVNHGNQCKTARMLGQHRNTLSRTMAELNVKTERKPTRAEYRASERARKAAIAAKAEPSIYFEGDSQTA